MKIGILGGTFDPIHWGHLFMGEFALQSLDLDLVYFAPAKMPPHKGKTTLTASERLALIELSLMDNPKFKIGFWDFDRSGFAYTYESIREVSKVLSESELYFIVGADSLSEFHTWKNPDKIIKYCQVVGLKRPGFEFEPTDFITENRTRFILLDCPLIEISSTDIRKRIQKGQSVRYYLHPKAFVYLEQKKLYRLKE